MLNPLINNSLVEVLTSPILIPLTELSRLVKPSDIISSVVGFTSAKSDKLPAFLV